MVNLSDLRKKLNSFFLFFIKFLPTYKTYYLSYKMRQISRERRNKPINIATDPPSTGHKKSGQVVLQYNFNEKKVQMLQSVS